MDNEQELYLVQYFGDLLRYDVPGHNVVFRSLYEALSYLRDKFEIEEEEHGFDLDLEDDRIVIWKVTPGHRSRVVWHFSGWHWNGNAEDLYGGPLEQGKFPGHDESVSDILARDY